MPYARRDCQHCQKSYQPRHHVTPVEKFCKECRTLLASAEIGESGTVQLGGEPYSLGAPMKQVVFDLETSALDRSWGRLMVASFLIHGGPEGPVMKTYTHRQSPEWKVGKRSNDCWLTKRILGELEDAHIVYAHNGQRFDLPFLNSAALKHGLPRIRVKIVDPCKIAWNKYRLGRNSLDAVAQFLGLSEEKHHIGPDVWLQAMLDDDDACWAELVKRCESDVRILNEISRRVTGDVGMVDYRGSAA